MAGGQKPPIFLGMPVGGFGTFLATLPPISEVINSWISYLPINSSSTACLANQTPKLWPSNGNMFPASPTLRLSVEQLMLIV